METRHGWITPVFGAALGIGIGLSLQSILADPAETWAGKSPTPFSKGEFGKCLRRVCGHVMGRSWHNVLWIAAGAICAALIISPGPGVCDGSLHTPLAQTCDKQPRLPSRQLRSAGLGIVILGGSIGQEIAFLLGLLSVRFGVNLKENREFLGCAHSDTAA